MTDALNKYQNGIGLINYIVFLVFLFLLPMPWHFVQPVWVIWLIAWALEGRWLQKDNYHFSKAIVPQLMIMLFILWEAISLIWTSDVSMGLKDISKHVYFAAVLIISCIGVNNRYKATPMKAAVFIGSIVAVISYAMVSYWVKMTWPANPYPEITFANYIGGPQMLGIKHHLYLCLVLLPAFCFSPDIYKSLAKRIRKEYAAACIAAGDAIILFGILASDCRIAIVTLPIAMIYMLFIHYQGQKKKSLLVGTIIGICVIMGIAVSINNRFSAVSDYFGTTYEEQKQQTYTYGEDDRPYLWHCFFAHVKDYGVIGKGLGSEEKTMNTYFEQDGQTFSLSESHNAHSTYFSTWLQLGPLAMLSLIIILCCTPFCYPKNLRHRVALICIIIATAMVTETILWRMSSLYTIFALLMLSQPYKRYE